MTSDQRQSLCSSSAVSARISAECTGWQQAGTWELAAMYAVTNLGVLGDIARYFPALRATTRTRAQKLISKYQRLLNLSFSEFKEHRESLMMEPDLSDSWTVWAHCQAQE